MVKFINNIICCPMADILNYKKTSQKVLSTSLDKTHGEFTLKLYKDNNFIVFTIQIHFSLYNMTYFKSQATITEKYQFDFSRPYVTKTKLIDLDLIKVA